MSLGQQSEQQRQFSVGRRSVAGGLPSSGSGSGSSSSAMNDDDGRQQQQQQRGQMGQSSHLCVDGESGLRGTGLPTPKMVAIAILKKFPGGVRKDNVAGWFFVYF
ncbi:MAG: hypothetical protein GY820_46550 [Gammaproteobacteria bacterium]|nr:hypothetical protein [Gammaproteobacteria bacterium]